MPNLSESGDLKQTSLGLFRVFFKRNIPRNALMVFCLIVGGFADGLGMMTFLPILEMLSQESTENPSYSVVTQFIESWMLDAGLVLSLSNILFVFVLLIVLKGLFMLVAMAQAGYTVARVVTDLRLRIIGSVMSARWSYFLTQPIGVIANSMTTESERAAKSYYLGCLMLAEFIQILVYTVIACMVSIWGTVVAIFGALLLFFVFRPLVNIAKRSGQNQTDLQRKVISRFSTVLQGMKPIKAMGREKFAEDNLNRDVETLNLTLRKQTLATQMMKSQQEPVIAIIMAASLLILDSYTEMSFAVIMVLALLFYRTIGRVSTLQRFYQSFVMNSSAYWSLDELARSAEVCAETTSKTDLMDISGALTLENMCFSIDKKTILSQVNVSFPRTGLVVINGPSGGGKTTLVDIVSGLLIPSSGVVRIGDIELSKISIGSWRKLIGYVPQEMTLFNDSVHNNITLGATDYSEANVWHVLRQVGMAKVIGNMSSGLSSHIGERGALLSGGERQRLALARGLVRLPAILILDEVTTALDPLTEEEICITLKHFSKHSLVIAVSHQPAVSKMADRILTVDGGSVKESFN